MAKMDLIGKDRPPALAGSRAPISNGDVKIKPKVLILIAIEAMSFGGFPK